MDQKIWLQQEAEIVGKHKDPRTLATIHDQIKSISQQIDRGLLEQRNMQIESQAAEAAKAQPAKASKYGLTAAQMKAETSGRNGGPTDKLLMKYTGFLRTLPPADVDLAEQLRASGVPVQAIMNRAR